MAYKLQTDEEVQDGLLEGRAGRASAGAFAGR